MNSEPYIVKAERIKDWLSQIEGLRFANNKLKECLAKTISKDIRGYFLEEAEHFHQRFIEMDQVIELMRHDAIALSKKAVDDDNTRQSGIVFLHFKQDMERCTKEFDVLEHSFYHYLSKAAG